MPAKSSPIVPVIILLLVPVTLFVVADAFDLLQGYHKWRTKWYVQTQQPESENSLYGVTLVQYPGDLVTYQELLNRIRPDFVIETGTFQGASALYYATFLEFINPAARVITVDIDGNHWRKTLEALDIPGKQKLLDRITFLEGSSTAPETLDKIKKLVPAGSKVLVVLDSAHTREHVSEELKLYAPFVSKDSYIIINDTDFTGLPEAIGDFLKSNDQFVLDRTPDRFFLTCAKDGFLKRVK